MENIHFISLEDVIFFHDEEMLYSGKSGWVRDLFELEASLESVKHTFDGNYLCDLYGMAAKYIVSFAIRHPFSDGNKRVGALCAVSFLEAHGVNYQENYDGELAEVVYKFLSNEMKEDDIRLYFIENSNKID